MRISATTLLLAGAFYLARAIDLNTVVHFQSLDKRWHWNVPKGTFSSTEKVTGTLARPPDANPLLCQEEEESLVTAAQQEEDTILLVPRGECNFSYKTLQAQRLGASGILIYNRLETRYDWNDTTQVMEFPKPLLDYECDNGGVAYVDSTLFNPPAYSSDVLDPLFQLDSPTNVCHLPRPGECDSRRCLVTNETGAACCAWDVPMVMGGNVSLSVFAVFLTMEQGDILEEELRQNPMQLQVSMSVRLVPRFNASSFLLWAFATVVVGFSSWYSAKDYRWAGRKLKEQMRLRQEEAYQERARQQVSHRGTSPDTLNEAPASPPNIASQEDTPSNETNGMTAARASHPTDVQSQEGIPSTEMDDVEASTAVSPPVQPQQESESTVPNERQPQQSPEPSQQQPQGQSAAPNNNRPPNNRVSVNPNTFELNMWHAAFFVIVGSTLLLLLFYFEFYKAVTVLYGVGCSGAMATVLIQPSFQLLSKRLLGRMWWDRPISTKWVGELSWLGAMALASAYGICAAWLYVGFTDDEPALNPFYWIVQNTMGACLSILFLSLIQLNSIKVATVLLVVVFIYDIFFVFLTPYIFDGDSVMVTVATGGGPAEESAGSGYCDRYPDDDRCQGGDPLPMLFTLPRINDYRGGSSLLGLGDILLPGLLISFAARLDEAKRVIAKYTDIQISKAPLKWYQGYLLPLVFAYAIGLLMAMLAVVFMKRGQPALLYLVPACLGTMFILGWHEIGKLWRGPVVIRWADRVVNYTHQKYPDNDSRGHTTDSSATSVSATTSMQSPQETQEGISNTSTPVI